MNRKLLSVILSAVCCLPAAKKTFAQADIHYSQFYENSILRNPALIGVFSNDYKVGVSYRNQWNSILNPYQTSMVNAEMRFGVSPTSNDFVSIGLLGYMDKAGAIEQKITAFYPAINYNKCMNLEHNTYLSAGFTGGYLQYSVDPTKATFNNQYIGGNYNSSNPTGENIKSAKFSLWDLGAGVNFNTSVGENKAITYVFGASGYHFTQPSLSYYKDPNSKMNMRFNVNGAMVIQTQDDYTVSLQANYARQGTYQEIIGGGLVSYNMEVRAGVPTFVISAGLMYRVGDAFIPIVKMRYHDYSFGFSYDVNVSSLKEATNLRGGFEITLFKTGTFMDRYAEHIKTVCPRM
jgi:type IX secretion system PorP/SprF family membrane protein